MAEHRLFKMSFASIYALYIAKAEKKGRTKGEVDEILCWLTGYSQNQLDTVISDDTNLKDFLLEAPSKNPAREQITGVICGVRIEEIEDPLMREVRYMDKLVDELARGRAMEKILRD